jgi:hypothetical protein
MKKKTEKDIKKQIENENSGIPERDSTLNSDELTNKFSNEESNRLDDIKKLASDFSMSDEPIEVTDDEFELDSMRLDSITSENDYLDRLDVLGQAVSPFTNEVNDEDFIDQRLDQINSQNVNIEPEEFEKLRKTSSVPFAPIPSFEDFEEKKPKEKAKKKIVSIEDIESDAESIAAQNQPNEDFVNRLNSSFEEDPLFQDLTSNNKTSENVFKTFDHELNGSELIEELEHEIDNANKVVNPFLDDQESLPTDDFLTNLDKLTLNEYELENNVENISPFDETIENDLMLSSNSWKDVLESTDDDESEGQQVFEFDKEQSFDDFLKNKDELNDEDNSEFPLMRDGSDETDLDNSNEIRGEDGFVQGPDDRENDQDDESVESLRRSFIDEFDQTAWEEELENKSKKKWLPRTIDTFKNWFNSLSIAERILIFLSFLIGVAVVISIVLVISQWSINNRTIASPPPAIEAAESDLIYPTGLQLPGGWFFFLQKGEIQDNKWEPQNAEWLANTKLRRVVAIPWSNQSEAVFQSLTSEDEISIYMNNNDIVIYQVEEVLQISRENVRILSDTEPSLVVILFREDNVDRWTIIAKPK